MLYVIISGIGFVIGFIVCGVIVGAKAARLEQTLWSVWDWWRFPWDATNPFNGFPVDDIRDVLDID